MLEVQFEFKRFIIISLFCFCFCVSVLISKATRYMRWLQNMHFYLGIPKDVFVSQSIYLINCIIRIIYYIIIHYGGGVCQSVRRNNGG